MALLRPLTVSVCVWMLILGVVSTTAFASDTGTTTPDSVEPAKAEGEGIEDLDVDEGYVEQLPPVIFFGQSAIGTALTVGEGTDGHYCGSFYIEHISYTLNSVGNYTDIHVQPTRHYAYFFAGFRGYNRAAWDAAVNCMRSGGPHGIYVRSWDAIEDQFLCHAFASINYFAARHVGHSWDLEGFRSPTNNPYTWAVNECGW